MSLKHLYVNWRHPSTLPGASQHVEMKFGKPKMPAAQAAPKAVALPDVQDVAVRKRQSEVLSALLKRRGRSSTLLSGRLGDQAPSAQRATLLGRGD